MEDLYVSGGTGLTLLNGDKDIALFSDVHNNNIYCQDNINHIKIAKLLEEKSIDNVIKLEEIDENNTDIKLTDLWPDADHTQELKQLAKKNLLNIKNTDIRPFLIPWSWELMKTDKNKFGNMLFYKYLDILSDFLNEKNGSKPYKLFVIPINYRNNNIKSKCTEQLDDLKNIFKIFLLKYKDLLNRNLKFIYKNNIDILYELNNILSTVMEWYTIVHTVNTEKNSIIHVGLAHSTRIKKLLIKYYSYNIKYDNGLTDLNIFMNNQKKKINSCLLLPKNISSIFNSNIKFGFYNN
jgi:hypothetical protein